ncbi:cell death-inducing p53 target 1 [Cichlidogyrus casuarinus]|uniref:Cell death-inducing p53 target 1 n=1 Tax=Cichlidogyrus casuarinus TaxID=1844966 RepID=A0ABD2Q1D9_9PLAT
MLCFQVIVDQSTLIALSLKHNVRKIKHTSYEEISTQMTDLGHASATTTCPNCQMSVTTDVQHKNGLTAWLSCILIACFGGVLGCCLIPFCCDCTRDAEHRCPRCHGILGTSKAC